MKRVLSFVCIAFCCLIMNAQLVTSRSVLKTDAPKEVKTTWMVKAGIATNNFVGDGMDDDARAKAGYNFGVEFNRTIGKKGAYWGMDFLLGSRGWKYSEGEDGIKLIAKQSAHNFQWAPFNFGWKIDIIDKITIDPHVGLFMSIDYAGKQSVTLEAFGEEETEEMRIFDDESDYIPVDLGLKIGVGVWFNNKFNLDLTYQRGFVNAYDDSEATSKASNFLIRLGYAF